MTDGMSATLWRYVDLERELTIWRREHPENTLEEDALLDQLDLLSTTKRSCG